MRMRIQWITTRQRRHKPSPIHKKRNENKCTHNHMADWQLSIGMDASAKEIVHAFVCQNTTKENVLSHAHKLGPMPTKGDCSELVWLPTALHCTVLYLDYGCVDTYVPTEYQPNRWRNARGEVCRKERIKFGFKIENLIVRSLSFSHSNQLNVFF